MALVAYSDDSDISSDEEINEEVSKMSDTSDGITKTVNKSQSTNTFNQHNDNANDSFVFAIPTSTANGRMTNSNTNRLSGIDSIVDEDEEDYIKTGSRSILDSIPAARPLGSFEPKLDVNEETDVITDVPTVDTWKLLKELKENNILPNGNESKSSTDSNAIAISKDKETSRKEQQLKKKKIQFIIPALSEFSDDEEEEIIEPERKKIKPSSKGTGLFSLLPEPKTLAVKEAKRSLVPHVLTKRPKPAPVKKKPKPKPTKKIDDGSDSEEDDDSSGDYFSLSSKDTEPIIDIGVSVSVSSAPEVPVLPEVRPETKQPVMDAHSQPTHHTDTQFDQSYTNSYAQQTPVEECSSGFIPFVEDNSLESSNSSHGMDEEAMRRLMGKKGKAEAINFIDVSADDALLTRDEWMTKALSEEKPTHSFSKKKEGLPTQKQKQKHQITYLAHQAKERELELKNNWASNRMSKLQTQAKYGF